QTGRNSCFSTKVLVTSFNLTGFYKSRLHAYASLLEEGTGMQRTANKSCMFVYRTATITFEKNDEFYKAGIPYTGTILLKGTNTSALKEKEFLLEVSTTGETQRKTLLVDGSGRASFELDTSGWNDEVSLHGELKDDPPAWEHEDKKYFDYPSAYHYLYPISSDSESFLKICRVEKKLPCGQTQKLWVDYLFDEKAMGIELHSLDGVLLVLAKGTIATVLRKELSAEAGLRGCFSLELPIGPELAPTAKVLGYVVLPNSEMVADSTELNVAKCFPNKVNLSFLEQRAVVGSQLHLKLQATPGSLCAIDAMDQHTESSGSKSKLKPSMVFNLFPLFSEDRHPFEVEAADSPRWWINRFINRIVGLPALNCFDMPGNSWMDCHCSLWRREVPVSDIQPAPDSLVQVRALQPSLTLLFLPGGTTQGAGGTQTLTQPMSALTNRARTLPKYHALSGNLLLPCREGGFAEMAVTVPDAITKWEAGMFCMSLLGLGLAPATTLTAFKPFFVELALPYAVVRHETFTLVATVFNYLRQCLWVQVTLAESAELEVSAGTDQGAHRGCVCADEERTFQWSIQAMSPGEVNVTIIAKALRSEKLRGTKMPVVPSQGHVDTETKLVQVQVS
ncbi:A2MG protein, partial [Chionis minor]|nr:A2MG protein [Chionis minor]